MSSFCSVEVKAFSVGFSTTFIIVIELKGIVIKLWSISKFLNNLFFNIKLQYTSN